VIHPTQAGAGRGEGSPAGAEAQPPDRARLRRLVWLIASGVLLMAVAAASALALVMSLVLTKDLPFESDGEAVMRILKETRGAEADAAADPPSMDTPSMDTPNQETPRLNTPSLGETTQRGATSPAVEERR
jgi:hypothetical protein